MIDAPKLLSDAQIARIRKRTENESYVVAIASGCDSAIKDAFLDRRSLLSHIAALQQRNEELRAFIDKHAHHDALCELHVLQWDENEKVGKPRRGTACTCGYDTDAAALSKSTQEPTR